MKNKCNIINLPLCYKKNQKAVSKEDFYIELYEFLQKISVVNTKSEFFDFVYINKKEIRRFIDRHNLFDI